MKRENKDLDEFFKEKFNSEKNPYEFNQNDWDLLAQKLRHYKKKRQRVLLVRTLVGAAAALLIFSIWMTKVNEFSSENQDTLGLDLTPPETRTNPQEPKERIGKDVEELHPNGTLANGIPHAPALKKDTPLITRREIDGSMLVYTLRKVTKSEINSFRLLANQLPAGHLSRLNQPIKVVDLKLDQDQYPEANTRENVVFSILVAPALNGVNGFKDGVIGGDLGFLVSVDITKKLSLSTGAVYAKKLYEADFNRNIYPNIGRYEYATGGYHPGGYGGSSDYGSIEVFPESVYADCRVLDIPLNVNYSLLNKGKNKINIGTGMSSYIMLKEKYQFEYAEQNKENAEKLELTNENKHLMSVLNFQASYTRQLNSKVGISLQPYLKIPLKDIGYAETKLQSVGMAVNVNISLTSNKK